MTHTPFELFHGIIFVFAHPLNELLFNLSESIDAVAHQGGAQHGYIRPRHEHFDRIRTAVDSTRGGETRLDPLVENGNPTQRETAGVSSPAILNRLGSMSSNPCEAVKVVASEPVWRAP